MIRFQSLATMAENLHVVMLPWSAFGHMIPHFQLAIALAKSKIHTSFVSTPKNIQRLPQIPPHLSSFITLVSIPLPKLNGDDYFLPEDAEATVDLPFDKIQYLKIALDLLRQPFEKFVAETSPDWIIVDFNFHWVDEISDKFGIPFIFYMGFSAAALLFFGAPQFLAVDLQRKEQPLPESLTSPPAWVDFPSTVAYQLHDAVNACSGVYGMNASMITDVERLHKVISSSKAMIIRTCEEIEGEYLNLYKKLLKKPVIPLGLLPPEKPIKTHHHNHDQLPIFNWLDKQNPKSVIFVGFGSECKLTKEQVFEIAYGLELSKLPFLWSLRKPSWGIDENDILPSGFSERTSERGIVSFGWAPQMEILAHSSIGGSFFHSGWGSAIEALLFRHCLIVLPLIIDQPLNAKLFVEKGLALEIKRSELDGSFTRQDIAMTLRKAMVLEEGEGVRARAREAAEIVGDFKLHQDHYIGAFVEFLRNGGSV